MLGATTIALIQADDVKAARPCLRCNPAHVMRVARTFESMNDDQGRMISARLLPVAVAQHAYVGRHVEVARLSRRKLRKRAPPRPRIERHLVAAGPAWMRNELEHSYKL